jgi:dTDP-4-dehydrorhamnose 3,5-epimerase-like enzyme
MPITSTETTIEDCKLLSLPKIPRVEGNITPIHCRELIPFDIARVYYIYDVPGGAMRGAHAHKKLVQLLVAAMGAFDVVLDDGINQKTVSLDRAYKGLLLPNMIWREIVNFSSGGICLVLASLPYDESDYIRDYDAFVRAKRTLMKST